MKVSDYAVLGDMRTGALVDPAGSIDWWCPPRFDAAAVFARIVGGDDAGFWNLAPRQFESSRRRYRGRTLVLETTYDCPTGSVRVTDFLSLGVRWPAIVRTVEGASGQVEIAMRLRARMHYGLLAPWTRRSDGRWIGVVARDGLSLHGDVPIDDDGCDALASFTVAPQQRVTFVLQWFPSYESPEQLGPPADLAAATESWWQRWSSRCTYRGRWNEAVARSALLLKALTFRTTGAIAAAMTTSLPERIGGDWNWDYRFCWLRDAAFAATSLLNLGYADEALAWREWFFRVYAGNPEQLHIMYGVAGERLTPEDELEWLCGFRSSKPVRVGNDAHRQFQLGVYGDVTRLLVALVRAGFSLDEERWRLLQPLVGYLERVWRHPGHGIWETRGTTHRYVHSIVMAWRAVEDLAILAGDRHPADRDRALALARRIRADVEGNGFDSRHQTFTAYYGARELDASLLLLPLHGFLPIDDPRVASTIAAIEEGLTVDGFVFRYSPDIQRHHGRLEEREGAFLMCGFWLVQIYVRQGRLERAQALFERLVATANDVGVLSEEFDVRRREALGNAPQAFSHSGLIDAALALNEGLSTGGRKANGYYGGREDANAAP